jgi:hypothetical protein
MSWFQLANVRLTTVQSGVMRGILEALAAELKIHGLIDVEEAFIDGSFAPSKNGAPRSGNKAR